MKKLTAFLLALVLALGLTACGSNESKQLVGTWQCTVDITEQIDAEISGALDAEYTSEVPMHRVYTGAEARHCGAELSGGRKARHDPRGI